MADWNSKPVRLRRPAGRTVSLIALRSASLLLTTALVPATALAGDVMPSGGVFTAGSGAISTSGGRTDITQSSASGIVQWNDFSIGAGNQVHFDNGNGATLNRVVGNVPTRIDGALVATGSVFLVNPAGVAVGTSGVISTDGAFAASTQNITDDDFLDGGELTFSGSSDAEILNAGTIRSEQGDIALIARRVENTGSLEAPNGTVALGAGYEVLMKDGADADGLLSVKLGGSDTEAVNSGSIAAANAEIRANGGNVYALAGNTEDVVKATGVSSSGGRIFLTAGPTGKVTVSGKLKARKIADNIPVPQPRPKIEGGEITITGGEIAFSGEADASADSAGADGGSITLVAADVAQVSGSLSARGGAGGTGGFVETSGAHLSIADSTRVTTLSDTGAAGTWLIDPNDLTIAASGGDITGAAISANLAGGNVTLSSNDGATGGNGDIFVNDAITWSADTTLTLDAVRNIEINADINASGGSAGLALTYGGDYSFGGGTVTLSGPSASLDIGGTAYTLIHDVDDLQAINGAGNYALAENIDATGTVSWNAGAGWAPIGDFSGILAGLGNKIDGLTLNRPWDTSVGMFSLASGGFRDFTLSNVSILGGGSAGALAYRIEGGKGVSNVHVTGSVTSVGGGGQVGGLIGWNDQTPISGSSSAATVAGFGEVGGLVGRLRAASITNSYATGAVTGTEDFVGGLVGSTQQGGTLTNVYASGNVTGTTNVGGLVGGVIAAGDVTATNAYWDVDSTGQGTSFAGTGIANANAYTQSTYSGFDFTNTWVIIPGKSRPMLQSEYSTSIATAHQLQLMSLDVGADYTLVGDIDMTSAFVANGGGYYGDVWGNAGFVTIGTGADPFTGSLDGLDHEISGLTVNGGGGTYKGLFGSVRGASFSNLGLVDATVTGGAYVGALAGYAWDGSTFTNVHAGGSVTASSGYTGMLVGSLNGGSMTYSSSSGAVTALDTAGNAGGLVGQTTGTTVLDNVFSTANVRGNRNLGGLVGTSRGAISNAYAMGSVTGVASGSTPAQSIGALAGIQSGGSITSSFATGYVSGANDRGGLVGSNPSNVTNSYWDKETTGVPSDAGGTAKTTADLQGALPTGFDSAIWGIGENLYPYLKWQYSSTPVAVSGKAYSDAGTTVLAGADVSGISGGSLLGTATTGANGYYYILSEAGSIDANGALAYLDGTGTRGAGFTDKVAATGASGLDIYGSSLRLIAGGNSLGGTLASLNATLGSYSDTDLNFFNPLSTKVTYDGYNLYLRADQAYTIDGSLSSGGLLSVGGIGSYSVSGDRALSAKGALSIGSAFQWSDGSGLTLNTTTGGDIQLDAGITASNGSLTIDGSGSIATGTDGTLDVALFDLEAGAWSQVAASLPSFSADDFRLDPANASFLRALGGDGSSGTPYQIADIYGLQGIGSVSLLAKDFVLANDIDASGTTGWYGGLGFDPIGTFAGVFSGQGHTISGLTIHRGSESSVGLFSVLSGTVSDVGLVGGDIEGAGDSGALVGTVNTSGVVTRSYSSASVSGSDNFTGGLVGHNYGSISLSFASGTVTSTASSAGGLVGVNENEGTVSNSYATGAVTAANYAGGFAGGNRGTLEHVYSTGLVSGAGIKGGLTSYNIGTITAAYWDTETSGSSSGYGTGITTAQLQSLSTFADAGWDIDDAGGTGAVWRIYDGHTAPLLRNFMTGLAVTGGSGTKTYDGSATSTDVGTLSYDPTDYDGSLVLGTAGYTAASADAGSYSGANLALGGLYSTQFGYDLTLNAGTLTVNKASLSVTADALSKTYGQSDPALTYTYSGLVGDDDDTVFSGALTRDSGENAGTYAITEGDLSAGGNYTISYTGADFTINKAALVATARNDSKTYDATAYSGGAGVTYSGFVFDDDASDLTGTLSYGGTAQGAVNASDYTLTVSGLGSDNYEISYQSGMLTIGTRAITVTADNVARDEGAANPPLTWTITEGSLAGVDELSGDLATTADTSSPVGDYDITQGTLAATSNYDLSFVAGTLTVTDPFTIPVLPPLVFEPSPPPSADDPVGRGPAPVCEAGVVGFSGIDTVYPCNRIYGQWLSAGTQ